MNIIRKLKNMGFEKTNFYKLQHVWKESEHAYEIVPDTKKTIFNHQTRKFECIDIQRKSNESSMKIIKCNTLIILNIKNDSIKKIIIKDDIMSKEFRPEKENFKSEKDILEIFPKKIQRAFKLEKLFK